MSTVFNSIALDIFAFIAIISSLLVITSKNPVISVLFLISVFVNSAVYLVFKGVSFIGISYIIVYVGAIAILFLFILMMINIKLTDILEIGTEYTKNLPLALVIASVFIFSIYGVISPEGINIFNNSLAISTIETFNSLATGVINTDFIFSSNPSNIVYLTQENLVMDTKLIDFTQIESLGHGLYTHNALLLIITSFILLLSMFAPIILSSNKKSQNS